MRIQVEVNGEIQERDVEPRLLLSDFVRHELGLKGTHVGCEHGICGACTVQLDGEPVRSCLLFAVQAAGHSVRTVEALRADVAGKLHPLQEAFRAEHSLQCGFCTAGFLMTVEPIMGSLPELDDGQLRDLLAGNICRCTGYDSIVAALRRIAVVHSSDERSA
jgi:aerobic-type carbon monoxide dehydrogenase small subunit (CoxS/CutS family)